MRLGRLVGAEPTSIGACRYDPAARRGADQRRALCARLGFRKVGTYEKHATLAGVWRDTVVAERLIPANLS